MEGITVLNSTAAMTIHPLGALFVGLGISIFFLGFIIALFVAAIDQLNRTGFIIICSTFLIGVSLSLGGIIFGCINPVEDYIKYDVLISEDVSFQEFYEKYEVIEVKGQIYTIKERSSK
jgi:hypothetical protein